MLKGSALSALQFVANMLFGISTQDHLTRGAVSAVLAAVAGVAVWIPARRAMHVDPMVALRCE